MSVQDKREALELDRPGMNGFLVILSHSVDDIPMSLHATEEEAIEAARKLDWSGMDYDIHHPFVRDASTPCCIGVLTFENGTPVKWDVLRHYEEEGFDSEQE